MSNNMRAGKPHICPVCRTTNSLVDNGGNWKCQAHVGSQICGHEIPKVYIPNTFDASATSYPQRKPSQIAPQDAQDAQRQDFMPREAPMIEIKRPRQRARSKLALIILCVVIIIAILALVFIFRRPWFEFSIA